MEHQVTFRFFSAFTKRIRQQTAIAHTIPLNQ